MAVISVKPAICSINGDLDVAPDIGVDINDMVLGHQNWMRMMWQHWSLSIQLFETQFRES